MQRAGENNTSGGGQCRDETTLAAAYQDHTFITVNIRELIDHRLRVYHLC